jgi:adenylate kinase
MLNGSTVCSHCGGELIQRPDDNEETVKSRLAVYEKQTAPLIEYYKKAGKLITVNGDQAVDEVLKAIVEVLG